MPLRDFFLDSAGRPLVPGKWYWLRKPSKYQHLPMPFYTGKHTAVENAVIWGHYPDLDYDIMVFYVGRKHLSLDGNDMLHIGHGEHFGFIFPDLVVMELVEPEDDA